MANERLEALLLEHEVLSKEQLEQAKKQQKSSGNPLDTCLVSVGALSEGDMLTVLSRIYDMPAVDLANFDVDKSSVDLLPGDVAMKFMAIPIRKVGRTLTLAMADPLNLYAIDDIKFIVGLEVQPVVAAESAVKKTIDRTNTVGTTWLGLTVGCAQCHSHKFDPVSQNEYYRLFAFFNQGEDVNNTAATVEVSEG